MKRFSRSNKILFSFPSIIWRKNAILNLKIEKLLNGLLIKHIPYYVFPTPPPPSLSLKLSLFNNKPQHNSQHIICRGNVVCILIIDLPSSHPHPNKTYLGKLLKFMYMLYKMYKYTPNTRAYGKHYDLSYRTKLKLYQHFHVSFFFLPFYWIFFFFRSLGRFSALEMVPRYFCILYTKAT